MLLLDPQTKIGGEMIRDSPGILDVAGEIVRSRLGTRRRVENPDFGGRRPIGYQRIVACRRVSETDAQAAPIQRRASLQLMLAAEELLGKQADRAVDFEPVAELQVRFRVGAGVE